MSYLHALTRQWRLSTKLVAALAIAMLPMGILAVVLAIRSYAAIGTAPPTPAQALGIVLPITMWVAALLTGWFAVHQLIVKPLSRIQRLITAYGASSDPARIRLRLGDTDHGSTEIAELAASFDAMADAVDSHSRELLDALAEQRRLTREVHHRVKNNLQIIASLLSLQARAADSQEVVQSYALIQARIQALTQVHRWMYDDATSNGVDLRALIDELCTGLENSLITPAHPDVVVDRQLAEIVIHPDIAVPVAFLVTELASLAAESVAPGTLAITITTTAFEGAVVLTIFAPGFLGINPIGAAGLTPTARIIHGMARQLRSQVLHDPVAGAYSVRFSASPL